MTRIQLHCISIFTFLIIVSKSAMLHAKEISSGTIEGQEAVLELLEDRYFNLVNENCISKTILNSPRRDLLISVGMRLSKVNLRVVEPGYSLNIETVYTGDTNTPPVIEKYLPSCPVRQ